MSQRRMVRVFISSTFLDMAAERDELIKVVFPQLRKCCEERGVAWADVDLRWGIPDEEKADQQVLPICLAEIDNCRPFFLCLLGERYGWVPDQIPTELIEQHAWLAECGGALVTEIEIQHYVKQKRQNSGCGRHSIVTRGSCWIGSVGVETKRPSRKWSIASPSGT